MLAYRSCASLTSERLPNSASASSKNSTRSPAAAAPKMRSRFFSVSPMYLLTTADRSTLYRSSPRSPATTSAASVLPVPDGPANSATTPIDGHRAELPPPVDRSRARGAGPPARAADPPRRRAASRSSQPRRGRMRTATPSRWPPASRRTAGADLAAVGGRRGGHQPQLLAAEPVRRVRVAAERAPPVVGVRLAVGHPDLPPRPVGHRFERLLPRRGQHPVAGARPG